MENENVEIVDDEHEEDVVDDNLVVCSNFNNKTDQENKEEVDENAEKLKKSPGMVGKLLQNTRSNKGWLMLSLLTSLVDPVGDPKIFTKQCIKFN